MSMRSLYRKVARNHGVSMEEVKRDMQAAITCAYQKSDKSERERAAQASVPHKGDVPDAEELIYYVAAKIKNRPNS